MLLNRPVFVLGTNEPLVVYVKPVYNSLAVPLNKNRFESFYSRAGSQMLDNCFFRHNHHSALAVVGESTERRSNRFAG